jgi:secondary thiamine-phosphate synthase enzyme
MHHHAERLELKTSGRSTQDITAQVQAVVRRSEAHRGLCNVFVHHTSASVILCENADPQVRDDLEAFASRLVPDGDPLFRHTAEGPDDMPAHVRTVLTQSSLNIPVVDGRAALGTWQGLYLWEHRAEPHRRVVTISILGA